MAKHERVVTHPKLYLSVGGVLQHMPVGTKVVLTDEQLAAGLGAKTASVSDAKPIDSTGADKAIEELKARAAAAEERAAKAEEALLRTAGATKK